MDKWTKQTKLIISIYHLPMYLSIYKGRTPANCANMDALCDNTGGLEGIMSSKISQT